MRQEQISVEAKVFRINPKYIRVKTNQDHVRTLADVLSDSKEWPFPPIVAQPIPVSEDETIKAGGRYYIIDGHHRVEAAILSKKPVLATVHSALTEADSIALQVSENAKHGMMLDVRSRQRALTLLSETGMKQVEIVKRTGLTASTVSRILSGKAGVKAGTETDARKGSKAGKKPASFSVETWLKTVGKVLTGWGKYRSRIVKAKGFPDGLDKTLDKLADHFSPEE